MLPRSGTSNPEKRLRVISHSYSGSVFCTAIMTLRVGARQCRHLPSRTSTPPQIAHPRRKSLAAQTRKEERKKNILEGEGEGTEIRISSPSKRIRTEGRGDATPPTPYPWDIQTHAVNRGIVSLSLFQPGGEGNEQLGQGHNLPKKTGKNLFRFDNLFS